jgi:hypothetical protein
MSAGSVGDLGDGIGVCVIGWDRVQTAERSPDHHQQPSAVPGVYDVKSNL